MADITARKNYIIKTLEPKLSEVAASERKAVDHVVDMILEADPTKNKQYSLWIANMLTKRSARIEDLYKASEYLSIFDRAKPKLAEKDINRYPSLGDLFVAIEPYGDYKSNNEIRRELADEIKKDIVVVYASEQGKILTPLTKQAAIFLGQGTQWCTAARYNNYFGSYNRMGPLYVILPADGKKFQFHLQSSQLMDARDRSVGFERFTNTYPWVFDNLEFDAEQQLRAVRYYYPSVEYIRNPTPEVAKYVIKKNYQYIRSFPWSEELNLLAASRHYNAIDLIVKPSDEVLLAALKTLQRYARSRGEFNPRNRVREILAMRKFAAHRKRASAAMELAVKLAPEVVSYVTTPSITMMKTVIKEDIASFARICEKAVTIPDELLIAALKKDFETRFFMYDNKIALSEAVQLTAVKIQPGILKEFAYYKIPTFQSVQKLAVVSRPDMIKVCPNDEETLEILFGINPTCVRFVTNASRRIKLIAVRSWMKQNGINNISATLSYE